MDHRLVMCIYHVDFSISVYRQSKEGKYIFIFMFKIKSHEIWITIELFIYSWPFSGKNMSV